MNKTISINLAHQIFHINEDAYAKLNAYLNAVERTLGFDEGKNEILADIEARIAEIFSEKLSNSKTVINRDDIQDAISILGEPEDYLTEDALNDTSSSEKYFKKLFRSEDDQKISGVCGGLAIYFGVDSSTIRLLMILFFIITVSYGILVYAVLWLILPVAITTIDKLKMKGEPININSIKENFNTESLNQFSRNVGNTGKKNINVPGKIIKIVLKTIAIFILSILSFSLFIF